MSCFFKGGFEGEAEEVSEEVFLACIFSRNAFKHWGSRRKGEAEKRAWGGFTEKACFEDF